MSSGEHESDPRLLDAAAKILRRRTVPGSPFYPLLEGIPEVSLSPLSEVALPYTERLSRIADPGQPQVGDMPPQPPTLRGRVGAVLVNVVRRMLFWYTGQIRAQNQRIAEAAREQARVLYDLSESARNGRAAIDDIAYRLNEQEQLAGQFSALETELMALKTRVEGIEQRLMANADSMRDRLESVERSVASVQNSQAEAEAETVRQQESLSARLNEMQEAIRAARQSGTELNQSLLDTTARLSRHERLLKISMEAQPQPSFAASNEIQRGYDRFFAEHAHAFRGDRDEIKCRLGVYLTHAQKAWSETGNLSALDLGCGRGEWLEVLKEAGIPAQGIDANREFIATCSAHNLDAAEGQLPQALYAIPDESRAIVSAIHVLEHLSFGDLLNVVDEAVRILKPGGIAIFETPNPKNVLVSSNNFYLDPTHHHPLPSEFLAFVLKARGLSELEVIPLQYAAAERLEETGSPAAAFINEHFFSALDYGIVARKPGALIQP